MNAAIYRTDGRIFTLHPWNIIRNANIFDKVPNFTISWFLFTSFETIKYPKPNTKTNAKARNIKEIELGITIPIRGNNHL